MSYDLMLLRHAKSSWPFGVTDRARPLSQRGEQAARRLGGLWPGLGATPEVVVVSGAMRAMATANLVVESGQLNTQVEVDDRLYAASWWDVLDVIRSQSTSVSTLLIVGHNPSLEDLTVQLAGPDSDEAALAAARTKFPTCALATLTSPKPWVDWGSRSARLESLWTPRKRG